MDNPGGSYAPRSPDLSALPSYDTTTPPFRSHQPLEQSHHQLLHSPSPPSHHHQQYSHPSQQAQHQSHPQRQEYLPPNFAQQPATSSYQPHPDQYYSSQAMPVSTRSRRSAAEADPEWLPQPALAAQPSLEIHQHQQGSLYGQPSTSHLQQPQQGASSFPPPLDEVKPCPGELEGIVVKTKFPVARIKRIVQADEDVGKVAQVTPVVVAKALEIFMISLTLRSAEEARARGVKKISGAHLKQVVQKDEQFDFLSDIVAKIPDAPASKKERDEDDDLDDMAEGSGRKKKGAPRKKRKEREGS